MEWKNNTKQTKQLTGSLSIFIPAKFRHIRCFLLLSMVLRLSVLRGMGGNALATDQRVSVGLMNNDE